MIQRLSIRFVLVCLILFVTLGSMLIITQVLAQTASNTFYQMSISSLVKSLTQVKGRIEDAFGSAISSMDFIAGDLNGRGELYADGASDRFASIYEASDEIVSVSLFDGNGHWVFGLYRGTAVRGLDVSGEKWFQSAMLSGTEHAFSSAHVQNHYKDNGQWVVTVARSVSYYLGGEKHSGVLAMDIWLQPIINLLDAPELESGAVLFLLSGSGEAVYHPDYRYLSMQNVFPDARELVVDDSVSLTQAPGYQFFFQALDLSDWQLVIQASDAQIAAASNRLERTIYIAFIAVAFFVLIVSFWLSSVLTRPLRRMQDAMQAVELNEENVHFPETGLKEYTQLARAYNAMLDKNNQLMEETVEKERQLHLMEFNALQEQINPHFLYNTLDSAMRMMETNRPEDAIVMIESLSKFFRIGLNRGNNLISVEKELEHVENYLTIQKIRFKQSFTSEIHMSEAVRGLTCPKLILQPIVENAIVHGVSNLNGCKILIYARREGDKLLIAVENNGLGFPPDRLQILQEALRQGVQMDDGDVQGIGLGNTNRRIQLLYGKEYGISIESEAEEKTCVTITLPA